MFTISETYSFSSFIRSKADLEKIKIVAVMLINATLMDTNTPTIIFEYCCIPEHIFWGREPWTNSSWAFSSAAVADVYAPGNHIKHTKRHRKDRIKKNAVIICKTVLKGLGMLFRFPFIWLVLFVLDNVA